MPTPARARAEVLVMGADMSNGDLGAVLTRRKFLTAGGATVVYLAGCGAIQGAADGGGGTPGRRTLSPWIAITDKSSVVVLVDKCEMGQGVRHMFATVVAEELGLTPNQVAVEDAPVDPALYGNSHVLPKVFGISIAKFQMTGGSSSTADMWVKLRAAAAGTHKLLVTNAADWFRVPAHRIELKAGQASAPGHPSPPVSFAALVGVGRAHAAPADSARASFSILGSPTAWRPRIDAGDKVTGRARFAIDLRAEDLREDGLPADRLLVAVVLRPARSEDSIEVLNEQSIRRMPGVEGLVRLRGGRGIAVVADTFWHADKARRAMRTTDIGVPGARAGSEAILQAYEKELTEHIDLLARTAPPAAADSTLWQTYVTPFGPHAAMEPLSATCVKDAAGVFHIYAASQFPQAARAQAARALDVPKDKVKIHGQLAGGAFGRRAVSDFIVEVAEVCRQQSGRAVKLIWTREDDFQHDYLRPCAASGVRAKIDERHRIRAWDHLLISESPNLSMEEDLLSTFALGGVVRYLPIKWRQPQGLNFVDITLQEGLADSIYDMRPVVHVLPVPRELRRTVRLGYWRSVGRFHTIFAVESMLDELAWSKGSNPLEIRRNNLKAAGRQARMLWCVEEVARQAGAENITRRRSGYGIACFSGWDSFAALVVEVSVPGNPREIRVERVWAAVDCGFVLNPDVLRQQVEGGIIFGLSAALKQEVTTVNGIVRETNFHACDSLRIHECPRIEVSARPYPDPQKPAKPVPPPTGVGELMVPLPAPALANAVFNLTDSRLRRIPLRLGTGT